jgi:hypothetical protein
MMEIWNKVKRPPRSALKEIKGGRLSGMTDINPQWRYQALTEVFGPCGIGWKYTITNLRETDGSEGQKTVFAAVDLYVKINGEWSEPIPGVGGSMYIAKEKSGLHTNDEAPKMAVTDALSVACKMLGVGADIYRGRWSGRGYREDPEDQPKVTEEQVQALTAVLKSVDGDMARFCALLGVNSLEVLPADQYGRAMALLERKKAQCK